jgi:hypothetical protein
LPIPPFREDGWLPIGHHPATWEEIVARFGGSAGSRRAALTAKLLAWRDAVRACGVIAVLLLNGSYVSAKEEPGDFDVLLIGPPDIQGKKDANPVLSALLDTEEVERRYDCSLFYVPSDSAYLVDIITLWDVTEDKVAKGSIEVKL